MGYKKILENFSFWSWKVLGFFVSKKAGTLFIGHVCVPNASTFIQLFNQCVQV